MARARSWSLRSLSLFVQLSVCLTSLSSASFPGGDGGGALRHVFDFPRLPFLAATAGRAAKPLGSSSPAASAHQVCAPLHFPSCWAKRSTPNPSLSRSRSLPLAHAAAASGIPLSRGPLPPTSSLPLARFLHPRSCLGLSLARRSGAAARAAGAAPQLGRKGHGGNAAAGETATAGTGPRRVQNPRAGTGMGRN